MTTLRQAAQQALEAMEADPLEMVADANGHMVFLKDKAITAIKETLAQPVQEPVACRFCHSKNGCWTWQCYNCGEIDDVQQPAPPPVQEPVAMLERNPRIGILKVTYEDAVTDLEEGVYALYTKPQGWRDHVAQAYLKGFDEGERRYRWLRKEFSEGRETYVAESVSYENALDEHIDRQMAKTSIKTQRWSGK